MKKIISLISEALTDRAPDKVFILTDANVLNVAKHRIESLTKHFDARLITIPAGEEAKNLDTLSKIWETLCKGGASRRSVLICYGGGMVTDIGGFAAACFKRGIAHINISTTMLGAVDAGIGGKTGIDFLGFKNEIGAFHLPILCTADTATFATLSQEDILSGWGEMIKTALIDDEAMTQRMLAEIPTATLPEEMDRFVDFCRSVKESVVERDPKELGLRKVLNLGHTAGHAFESLLLEKGTPLPHGVCIAYGLLTTLVLSRMIRGLNPTIVSQYRSWLRDNFPTLPFGCKDFDLLWDMMMHDKKNAGGPNPLFVLLDSPGNPIWDIPVDKNTIFEALEYTLN